MAAPATTHHSSAGSYTTAGDASTAQHIGVGGRRHSYTGTPATATGFHFPASAEGSLPALADKAQELFARAIELLATDIPQAQKTFTQACAVLPKPTEDALKEASGSDRAIYTAVARRAAEVDALIQKAIKDFAG